MSTYILSNDNYDTGRKKINALLFSGGSAINVWSGISLTTTFSVLSTSGNNLDVSTNGGNFMVASASTAHTSSEFSTIMGLETENFAKFSVTAGYKVTANTDAGYSTVFGWQNRTDTKHSSIFGYNNYIYNLYPTGTNHHEASGSTVLGGASHIVEVSAPHAVILGGLINKITGLNSSTPTGPAGNSNASVIIAGNNNIISASSHSAIVGQNCNTSGHSDVCLIGNKIKAFTSDTTYIESLCFEKGFHIEPNDIGSSTTPNPNTNAFIVREESGGGTATLTLSNGAMGPTGTSQVLLMEASSTGLNSVVDLAAVANVVSNSGNTISRIGGTFRAMTSLWLWLPEEHNKWYRIEG